jgi:hypothetical protein
VKPKMKGLGIVIGIVLGEGRWSAEPPPGHHQAQAKPKGPRRDSHPLRAI